MSSNIPLPSRRMRVNSVEIEPSNTNFPLTSPELEQRQLVTPSGVGNSLSSSSSYSRGSYEKPTLNQSFSQPPPLQTPVTFDPDTPHPHSLLRKSNSYHSSSSTSSFHGLLDHGHSLPSHQKTFAPSGSRKLRKPQVFTGLQKYENYSRGDLVGEGTYGQVYKGRHRATGDVVAMKRIRILPEDKPPSSSTGPGGGAKDRNGKERGEGGRSQSGEGIPITALREMALLQRCTHKNVVLFRDCFLSQSRSELSISSSSLPFP